MPSFPLLTAARRWVSLLFRERPAGAARRRPSPDPDGAVQALRAALDARDPQGGERARCAALVALKVGAALALGEAELAALQQGAALHDLGKLALPDALLTSCGPSERAGSADGWTLLRAHPEQGFDLAAQLSGAARGALGVIRYHHERWDGGGYPAGLTGEAIPLLARVFAVGDTYAALTSPLPGRPARSHSQAVAEIAAQAGRQFDPKAVAAFLLVAHDLSLPVPAARPADLSSTRLVRNPALLN